MTYIGDNHAKTARSYAAQAGACKRRAEREAQHAADAYRTAALDRANGRRAAGHPELPAIYDARVRQYTRIGDIYLRMSFQTDGREAHFRRMAARYRALRDRRAASIAELAGK
jgi:hypothetical protein